MEYTSKLQGDIPSRTCAEAGDEREGGQNTSSDKGPAKRSARKPLLGRYGENRRLLEAAAQAAGTKVVALLAFLPPGRCHEIIEVSAPCGINCQVNLGIVGGGSRRLEPQGYPG